MKKLISVCLTVVIAFNLILFSSENVHAADDYVVSQYFSNVSYAISGDYMKITYTVKKAIPSNVVSHIQFGYSYPVVTRTAGKYFTPKTAKGTYTATLSRPRLICEVRVHAKMDLYGRRYEKVYASYFNRPYSGSKTSFHTVTTAEQTAYWVMITVPGLLAEYHPKLKGYKILQKTIQGFTLAAGAASALDLTKGPPAPKTGQYWRTKAWYSSYKLYVQVTVWNSKESYNKKVTPIYDATKSYDMVKY